METIPYFFTVIKLIILTSSYRIFGKHVCGNCISGASSGMTFAPQITGIEKEEKGLTMDRFLFVRRFSQKGWELVPGQK
jgi:hypothetical protein